MSSTLSRNVAPQLTTILANFFKNYHQDPSFAVTSYNSRLYNNFIVQSFGTSKNKRYSISQLATVLKENNITSEDVYYLILRYIDGMYLLLTNANNDQENFWP